MTLWSDMLPLTKVQELNGPRDAGLTAFWEDIQAVQDQEQGMGGNFGTDGNHLNVLGDIIHRDMLLQVQEEELEEDEEPHPAHHFLHDCLATLDDPSVRIDDPSARMRCPLHPMVPFSPSYLAAAATAATEALTVNETDQPVSDQSESERLASIAAARAVMAISAAPCQVAEAEAGRAKPGAPPGVWQPSKIAAAAVPLSLQCGTVREMDIEEVKAIEMPTGLSQEVKAIKMPAKSGGKPLPPGLPQEVKAIKMPTKSGGKSLPAVVQEVKAITMPAICGGEWDAAARRPSVGEVPSPENMKLNEAKTLMVRNIPVRYTQDMLLKEWPNNGEYDFLYLPICIGRKGNVSFAFINFVTEEAAYEFHARWHKQRLQHFSARKPLDISPAHVQGRDDNLLQIVRNKTFRIRNTHFQPAIFQGTDRINMEDFLERLDARLKVRLSESRHHDAPVNTEHECFHGDRSLQDGPCNLEGKR
mmetsp:Transcript_22435/g.41779  ORF Transcript_22435/g.41779 Transcript_22435/m.41779 type:complete len:474 (-) Transcript_22435:115-1536(-)